MDTRTVRHRGAEGKPAVEWVRAMRLFVSVVQHGSLSAAGRQAGLSTATVSRLILALEEGLGGRLLNRTTRKLSLTEAGQIYFRQVELILHQISEANDSVAQLQSVPRGTLRVHSRMLVGHQYIVPALPGFLAKHPEIRVDLIMSNLTFFGEEIGGVPAHKLARRGMLHVREGRHVFPAMTVEENLQAAMFALTGRSTGSRCRRGFDEIYAYFPQLAERRDRYAGLLSGGEQQMLVLGRALVAEPRLLLVDEASLGLAPLVARKIFDILARINRDKRLAILAVEQNVSLALKHASYAYVIENGGIVLEGTPADLADRDLVSSRYLGGAASGGEAH